MVDQLTFRTNDATRWGPGNGMDLTAQQIDINFWILYGALVAIQDHLDTSAGIASILVNGTQMTVMLTNHVALGPFTLPTAAFNWRGEWQAGQSYNINDVFQAADVFGQQALWLVVFPVANSGATFNQFANDGAGHNWWAEILAQPLPEIPLTGPAGGLLQLTGLESPGTQWVQPTRNLALYVESEPNPLETVLRYVVTEQITFPEGLTGSRVHAATQTTTSQAYEIYWNGANIGSVNFAPSPTDGSFTFLHQIVMEPGDVLTVVAPSVPDPHLTGIAFTLVGTLTGVA